MVRRGMEGLARGRVAALALAVVYWSCYELHVATALPVPRPLQRSKSSQAPPGLRRIVSLRHIPDAVAATANAADSQAAEECAPRIFDDQMTALTVQVLKSLMGSSIFMLSGGLAGVTNVKWAWIPASAVTMSFALVSAYTYCLVGACCDETGAQTYTDLWSKTISPSSAWLPTTGCAAFTAIACQVYTIVMRDITAQLITACTMTLPLRLQNDIFNSYANSAGLSGLVLRRETHLMLLGAVMLRLCLLRSLTALAKVSWVGMGGVLYITAFMFWRCTRGAYLPGGQFRSTATWPIWGQRRDLSKVIVFVSLLHGCYQVHYDAPRFFSAISMRPDPMRHFRALAFVSFSVAGLVGVAVLASGFLTFGASSKSVILNNYAPVDRMAVLGRLAVFVSLMSSFPLIFNGFASNMLSLADFFAGGIHDRAPTGTAQKRKAPSAEEAAGELRHRQGIKDAMAVVLVCGNLCIGLTLEDLGFLCSFCGAVISGVIIFVFPPMFHLRVLSMRAQTRGRELGTAKAGTGRGDEVAKREGAGAAAAPVWLAGEVALWWSSCLIAGVGVVLCALGAAVNLKLI